LCKLADHLIGKLLAMASNTELEERWINAWNDLFELTRGRREVPCQLPDDSVVTIETCQAWLQEKAYEGHLIEVADGWVQGKRGVVARILVQ
jgi:hypothetical protein